MGHIQFFNQHYLKYFWIVGIIFAILLLVNFVVDKIKYNRFDKVQQKKKIEQMQALKEAKRVKEGL